MQASSVPDRDSITSTIITNCVNVYRKALFTAYESKVKQEKRKAALEDDDWRYNKLPSQIKDRPKEDGLSRDELARLVQWKITHGIHRPFLPGMIQKNSPEDVTTHTSNSRKLLSQGKSSSKDTVKAALDAVCKLKGVGPATGTLVLSVFDPDNVPFFEDELFHWLFPKHGAKLKYDVKEYTQLAEAAREVMERTGVTARQLEHAAFVLQHLDALDTDSRNAIFQENDAGASLQEHKPATKKSKAEQENAALDSTKAKGRKLPEEAPEESANTTRKAKRAKK